MEKSNTDYSGLNSFSEGMTDVFFVVENFNGRNSFFVSGSVEKISGYSPAEIKALPEHLYSIVFDEDLSIIKKTLTELENDSALNKSEISYRIKSKNGGIVWLNESLLVERDSGSGKIVGLKSAIFNITNIKNKERELQKSVEALKELNVSKDKFISIISHDLRAPFTTLLGFSEILLNESEISDEEKSEYLRYIYDASKSQLNLINCLLDWSRLQTGRIKVEPVRLNVKQAVSTAITPLTGDAVRKNIDIKMDLPPDLHINADERLFAQTVINLTNNAIKFTPEGKDVHISSSRFKEGMIEIVVRDEGLGISEENQSKLFRIDQKFSLVGTNGEKGSGLGLTLVKEIVEKHGGQVWFYSQVNEGSEFHFTVPEAKNLILLIEDNESARIFYKDIVESALPNFEVKFAANGYEAINLYRDLLPTIIITDHDMPLMNGIQLVEAIHKKEANRSVPIIVISAKLSEEITKKYAKLGVDKIVSKPVDREHLVQVIRECLY